MYNIETRHSQPASPELFTALYALPSYTALPKSSIPKVAITLRIDGTVLRRRMARGIDEPPSTIEAKRLNSIPYGSPVCVR